MDESCPTPLSATFGFLIDMVELHKNRFRLLKPFLSFSQNSQDSFVYAVWGVISHRCDVELQGLLPVILHDSSQISAVQILGWVAIHLPHFLDQRCVDTTSHCGKRCYLTRMPQCFAIFRLGPVEHLGVPQIGAVPERNVDETREKGRCTFPAWTMHGEKRAS